MSAPAQTAGVARGEGWWEWRADPALPAYTVGVEEEAMMLDPHDWTLAQKIDTVLPALSPELAAAVTPETHGSALELRTGIHASVGSALAEMRSLRSMLAAELAPMGLRAASIATHPCAVWSDTVVSSGSRHQFVYGSMRELARREPTFALHVHVGVPTSTDGIRLANRMRAHIPLLLALSVNSPFWQGRDSGLASTRTPLFQAFPRVGIPRLFRDYDDYVSTVDLLIRCAGLPDSTYLWWDVRPQPRLGTVEVRIMDAQTTIADTGSIVALIQALARLEVEQGFASRQLLGLPEVLDENRFLAARDGMRAELIDPGLERAVPARELLAQLVAACRPHARALGCLDELGRVEDLGAHTGAERQRELAHDSRSLTEVVAGLSDRYLA